MITYKNVRDTARLTQILKLQAQNVPSVLSGETQKRQGFVTVQHDLALLQNMAAPYGHAVALDNDQVIGYALVMLPEFSSQVTVLQPMFDRLDNLTYQGKPVTDYRYFVMGQVCVAYAYRGQGIFAGLYQQLKASTSSFFDIMITEVATRNRRSLRAHRKVGFQRLDQYTADTGETWDVLLWNFTMS